MINKTRGSILISVCYGAILTSLLGVIVASSVLITLQGIKLSKIQLEGVFYGNNIIEEFKLKNLEEYMGKRTEIKGITSNDGEELNIEVLISKEEDFFLIEVILGFDWGREDKELIVRGYKYEG